MNPIDLVRLRDFSDGTEAGLRDLAGLLVTHMNECLEALQRGAAERNGELLRTEAHRGAGTFGACGAQPLSVMLGELETLAAEGRVAEASALLPRVETEAARVRQFLDAALAPERTHDSGATRLEQ